MKKILLYTSAILLSAFIMNYDLSLNYKSDLNDDLAKQNFKISNSELLACPDLTVMSPCPPEDASICGEYEVVEWHSFGGGFYYPVSVSYPLPGAAFVVTVIR